MNNVVDNSYEEIVDDLSEMRDKLYEEYSQAKDAGKLLRATEYAFQALGIQLAINYLNGRLLK